MKKTNLVLIIILLSAITAFPFLKKEYFNENINITVSEDVKQLKITADFPKTQAKKVHHLLENELNIKNIDLNVAEIKNYEITNHVMQIYLKSENDYLKIVMDRRKNSTESYHKLKSFSEKLKNILAE